MHVSVGLNSYVILCVQFTVINHNLDSYFVDVHKAWWQVVPPI